MINKPLISFCIPTYKRTELLKETIRSVLNQTYKNTEIIVSDNDPAASSQKVVQKFRSKKIKYIVQKKNVGMMRNFGKAFDQSSGDFIVFLGDDDPIEPDMLEILTKLWRTFPDAGSYFGAPYLLVHDSDVTRVHGLKNGNTGMRSKKIPKNKVRIYNPEEFLPAFLSYQIFDYFFWSCGMVRRDIVKKVGKAHPLNGSNLLTDYAYVLRVGTQAPVVTINREVGCQRIHGSNYGRKNDELLALKPAI
jgi:glycosyltransferase involved in cell wall biosynthesis